MGRPEGTLWLRGAGVGARSKAQGCAPACGSGLRNVYVCGGDCVGSRVSLPGHAAWQRGCREGRHARYDRSDGCQRKVQRGEAHWFTHRP